MPLPVKELLLHDRKEGEASQTAQQWCGEQKITQRAELPSGLWSSIWLAPAGPSVGLLPAWHAMPASVASQPPQPLCRWRQVTGQNNVKNIYRSTV